MKKRFEELADKSYRQGIYLFTDFLSTADASDALDCAPAGFVTLYGGADGCERVVARFGNPEEFGYEEAFPIEVIKAEPLIKKFADELSHRDYLGALMNLGIERDVLGDIIVRDKTAYIFALNKMSQYICDNLDRVKHTSVKCTIMDPAQLEEQAAPSLEHHELTVASVRLDAVIAKLYNISRSAAIELFCDKKIFVNGRQCENNSCEPKTGDAVSVRGYGRFIYGGEVYTTKKGKICVSADKYV